MPVRGIVMGPVDDRWAAGIVHHFAADFDAVGGRTGHRGVISTLSTTSTGPAAVRASNASCTQWERVP
ncbi:MAG TPA: hypothetical protein VGF86_05215 [Candidatus Tumulicola sp.]